MAVPTSFDESNGVLGRPIGMTEEECDPLSVCHAVTTDGTPVVISCWELTEEELTEIIRTKRVWLGIFGETMPPAYIAGVNPIQT